MTGVQTCALPIYRKIRRVEVVGGDLLPDNVNMQEIKSGLEPGQQVVANALVLDHVLAQ